MEFDEKSSHKGLPGLFLTSLTGFSSPNREKRPSSWILQRAPLRRAAIAFFTRIGADTFQIENLKPVKSAM